MILKLIYKALSSQLKTILPVNCEIDWYGEQYQQNGDDTNFAADALYIEFLPLSWQTLGNKLQTSVCQFRLHWVQSTEYRHIEDTLFDTQMGHLETANNIFKLLQAKRIKLSQVPGYELLENSDQNHELMSGTVRIETVPDHTGSNLFVTTILFETTIFDYSAMVDYVQVETELQLALNLDLYIFHPTS